MDNKIISITGKIPYFWIAFYDDGTILPQYEYDGTVHLFKEIDQSRLKKFGWFPFTRQLATTLRNKFNDDRFIDNPTLPYFVLELKQGQRLIALRREIQRIYTFSKCLKCGFEWQWCPKVPLSFREWMKRNYPKEYETYKGEMDEI